MKSLKDYLAEEELTSSRKYIAVYYDDETQQKLRDYCVKNGFDLTLDDGEQQPIENFKFHTTIFYTVSEHKITNEIKTLEQKSAIAVGFDLLGENHDIPVLTIESSDILDIRKHFENKYNMKDEWPEYKPHVSLSYAKENLPDLTTILLPDFELTFDKLKIDDILK